MIFKLHPPAMLACAEYTEPAPAQLHDRVWLPLGGIRRHQGGRLTLAEIADTVSASTTVPATTAALDPGDYWREVTGDDEVILDDDTDDGRQLS